MSNENLKKIAQHWEDPATLSIIDRNLNHLERQLVLDHLQETDRICDMGCGNGEASVQYSKKVRECLALEQSAQMRSLAQKAIDESGQKNIKLREGNLLNLDPLNDSFDKIITQRVLINLDSWENQKKAIKSIYRLLKPDGRYIMIENTNQSFKVLNDLRVEVGLRPIAQHWHNLFFDQDQLVNFLGELFDIEKTQDFGLYYLLTRVYTQMFASFEGFGVQAKKDPIFEQSDKAARVFYEQFKDRIKFASEYPIGPILGFVLKKKAQ